MQANSETEKQHAGRINDGDQGTMTIYIDADACPVTRIAEDIARKYGIPVTLLDYIILHVPEAAIMGKSGIKAIRIIIPDEDI